MSRAHHPGDENDISKSGDTIEFKPRAFKIIWGRDKRYWTLPAPNKEEPLVLLQVSWLEVTGETEAPQGGNYKITFKLEKTTEAFGWTNSPLCLMARAGNSGKYITQRINIDAREPSGPFEEHLVVANPNGESIKFGLYEVWTGKWKGGLKIHGATVKRT